MVKAYLSFWVYWVKSSWLFNWAKRGLRHYELLTLLTFTAPIWVTNFANIYHSPPWALHSRSLVQHHSLLSEQRKLHTKCHAFHFITDIWKYFLEHYLLLSERDTVLIERSNLVNISKLVVKEVKYFVMNQSGDDQVFPSKVIESSLKFGRQLDSDHIPLQHFFIVLEHVLRHGVRPKKVPTITTFTQNEWS